jgi:hypothetical protein
MIPPTCPQARVCTFGDGQAIMARPFGDFYFSTVRSYLDWCAYRGPLLGVDSGQSFRKVADAIADYHLRRYGIPRKSGPCDQSFQWWFQGPRSCSQLCEESKGDGPP